MAHYFEQGKGVDERVEREIEEDILSSRGKMGSGG
jgi:hypothetical protein